MKSKHLLDPEISTIATDMPPFELSDDTLDSLRAISEERVFEDPDEYDVTREEITIPGQDHSPRCLLYQPKEETAITPGYLHIHGGGYVAGKPLVWDGINLSQCRDLGIVILSVGYRLAPEHPIPAPLDDCYTALAWFHDNADSLGVDPGRIAIGGESAGGGLAAALAIKARDEGEYPICHQHLTYPMLDSTTGSESNPGDPFTGEFVWTRSDNQYGWKSYLGDAEPVAPQVPARLENYEELPSTWMFTAALDLFRDENIAYAQNLMKAGVGVELVSYPGVCHGFQFYEEASVTKRFYKDHQEALARFLGIKPK